MGQSRPLFLYFQYLQLIVNIIWWCMDSNCGSLVSTSTIWVLGLNYKLMLWLSLNCDNNDNGPIPASFFFICVFSIPTVDIICRWLDSNGGSLVWEHQPLLHRNNVLMSTLMPMLSRQVFARYNNTSRDCFFSSFVFFLSFLPSKDAVTLWLFSFNNTLFVLA